MEETQNDVWEWCRKRGMEIEKSEDEIEASEPGLTVYHNEHGVQIEQRNPEVGVLTYINTSTNQVSVIGSQLVIEEGDTQTVLKATE